MMILTFGFLTRQPWAEVLWPWPIYRMSTIFIASITAAIGVPIFWLGVSGERAAIAPGALNLGVMFMGMAAFTLSLYLQDISRQPMLVFAIISFVLGGISVGLFFWCRKTPFKDNRRIPMPVLISFGIFAIVLILVGGALVLKRSYIFPWPLWSELSVMYGWIFLGASCYFLYTFIRPKWGNACGQLLGFLAYDLILIVPYLAHFKTVQPEMLLSLVIYTSVIIYSGLLAGYYLFIHRETRFFSPKFDPT